MKLAILFAFLLISSISCVSLQSLAQVNMKLANELQEIQDTTMGQMLISLVEVHMETGGPLDELFKEVENLKNDLIEKFEEEQIHFKQVTDVHNDVVVGLEAEISKAKTDISTTDSKLKNTLYPMLAELKKLSSDLKSQIGTTEKDILDGDAQRVKEHQEYVVRQQDHKAAVEALNEAIKFVEQLKNPETVSLIQVRQAKKSLNFLQTNALLKSNIYSPLIQALISLSKNFSDQETIDKILGYLQKVLDNVEQSQVNEAQSESDSVAAWKQLKAQLNDNLLKLRADLVQCKADIESTQTKIADSEAFLALRKQDLTEFQADLKAEHQKFVNLTAIHEKVVAELKHEQDTLERASVILDEAKEKLSGYIQGVMNK